MQYFNGVSDLDTAKRRRRALALQYHPDRHPDEAERYTRIWQEVEEEYTAVRTILLHQGSLPELVTKIRRKAAEPVQDEASPSQEPSQREPSPFASALRRRLPNLLSALLGAGCQWITESAQESQVHHPARRRR